MIVGGGVFLVLALAVIALPSIPGDVAIREWLLGLATPPVVEMLRVINHAGSGAARSRNAPAARRLPARRRRWWIWFGLMLAAPAIEGLTKALLTRPVREDLSMGFPSGHATAAAAYFGAVFYLPGRSRLARASSSEPAPCSTILLVALARVILRAHWPADSIAGIGLGLALASAAVLLNESGRPRSRSDSRPSRCGRGRVHHAAARPDFGTSPDASRTERQGVSAR